MKLIVRAYNTPLSLEMNRPEIIRLIVRVGNFSISSGGVGGGNTGYISAGGATLSLGTAIFSNGNGVSFGVNGQTVTASVNSNAGGAAISASASSQNSGTIVFSNSNNVSFGFSNGVMTATASGGGGGAVLAAGSQTGNTSGTVLFDNGNGITFGMSNSSVITASYNSTQFLGTGATQSFRHTSADSQLRFTSADSQLRFTSADSQLQFTSANSNFVQATAVFNGTNAAGTIASGAISVSVAPVTNSSFSVQDSATTLNPVARIAFSTGNNITLSLSTGASSGTVGVAHNLAGTSTGFNGGASISGSMTHNSSGLNISLSHPAWITTATQSSFSVQDSATTLNPVARIAFSTGNNITLSLSTGASSATVGIAHNLAGTSTGFTGGASISGSMTHNSSGLAISLSHPAWITTATQSSFSVQDSATTLNPVARIAFSTGNNITLSLSTGASSATVGIAHNLAGTSTGFTGGASISGSMTHNSSGLAISLSHPAWNTATASVVNISAGTTSNVFGNITFSNSNGVSFGLNGSTLTASTRVLDLVWWDNMAAGMGVPQAGSSGTINMATKGTLQNTVHVFPFGILPGSIAPNTMFFQMSHSASGNSSSAPKVFTIRFGLYTRNASSLSLLNSCSTAISLAANAANSTGYSGIRWISIHSSLWSAAPTFSNDVEYYGAMFYSTGGNNSLAQTAGFMGFYPYQTAANSGVFGVSQTTASTQGFAPFIGVFSATGVIPSSIQASEITKQGGSANFVPFIALNNLNSYL